MKHQIDRKKLNVKPAHKKALLRNQAIHLITYGHLTTKKTVAKEVQRFIEKIITITRAGENFNTIRRVKSLLPYKNEAVVNLFKTVAPRYTDRNGGYTRVISLGRRMSDTCPLARLEWV